MVGMSEASSAVNRPLSAAATTIENLPSCGSGCLPGTITSRRTSCGKPRE